MYGVSERELLSGIKEGTQAKLLSVDIHEHSLHTNFTHVFIYFIQELVCEFIAKNIDLKTMFGYFFF